MRLRRLRASAIWRGDWRRQSARGRRRGRLRIPNAANLRAGWLPRRQRWAEWCRALRSGRRRRSPISTSWRCGWRRRRSGGPRMRRRQTPSAANSRRSSLKLTRQLRVWPSAKWRQQPGARSWRAGWRGRRRPQQPRQCAAGRASRGSSLEKQPMSAAARHTPHWVAGQIVMHKGWRWLLPCAKHQPSSRTEKLMTSLSQQ
mmetsp:Transcript_44032/g.111401  ORF Transcript_44032/g.111401 Transcript_44032/m.111401 type:complete len:201 (+) Transcript_44032:389-991(+)